MNQNQLYPDPNGNKISYPHPSQGANTNVVFATSQPTMTVAMPVGNAGPRMKRPWTNDLCGCGSNIGGFFFAWCLPCCYKYKLYTNAGEGCCDCFFGGLVELRTKIRTERGIEGSICNDVCTVVFCGVCAMVQMDSEMQQSQPLI